MNYKSRNFKNNKFINQITVQNLKLYIMKYKETNFNNKRNFKIVIEINDNNFK